MLRADEREEGVLEGGLDDLAPTLLGELVTEGPAGAGANAEGEPLPQSIGGYRILGKLGEGGMGLVYEAQQAPSGEWP